MTPDDMLLVCKKLEADAKAAGDHIVAGRYDEAHRLLYGLFSSCLSRTCYTLIRMREATCDHAEEHLEIHEGKVGKQTLVKKCQNCYRTSEVKLA